MSSAKQRAERRAQREMARQQIHDAAEAFLREHPFREMSIDAVMGQTQLARTAFYRHFDDVTELVLQLLGEVGGELYAIIENWVAGARDDVAGATHTGLSQIVDFFQTHGPLVRAVADAASTDERVETAYDAYLRAFDGLIAGGLDAMIESGRLEPCDTRALARALNLMGERYMLDSFGRQPFGDPVTAIATLELIWLRIIDPGLHKKPQPQRRSASPER